MFKVDPSSKIDCLLFIYFNFQQMEFELCVPTEPVSVSQNKVDPATDVIVQNLSIFPLQLRTKLNLNNKHQGMEKFKLSFSSR